MRALAIAVLALLACGFAVPKALALSEIQREDVPIPEIGEEPAGADGEIRREELPPPIMDDAQEGRPPVDMTVPLPDPIVRPRESETPSFTQADEEEAREPVPEILYDPELLPEPVRRMRDLIMEACLSGDIERLRPLTGTGETGTQLSFGAISGDPVEFLRGLSGDEEGHEILAILYEVLAAGFVRLDEGEPGEMYVWPYFFAVPLADLDARQRVELFKLVTAGDYEDMKNYGSYIFYRVGISPEGRWLFFVAGD